MNRRAIHVTDEGQLRGQLPCGHDVAWIAATPGGPRCTACRAICSSCSEPVDSRGELPCQCAIGAASRGAALDLDEARRQANETDPGSVLGSGRRGGLGPRGEPNVQPRTAHLPTDKD